MCFSLFDVEYMFLPTLQFIIVYGLMGYEPLSYEGYVYPVWANILGWLIACSSIVMIPGMAIYKICSTPGSFLQVSSFYYIYNFECDNLYKINLKINFIYLYFILKTLKYYASSDKNI